MSSNQQISDYVYYYPQVLDSNICNNIVNYFDKNAKWTTSTFSTAYKNTGTSQVIMDEYWIRSKDEHHEHLKTGFEQAVNDYISVYDKIKIQAYTQFRINRYGAGGFMNTHIDNIHYSHGQQQGYPHLTSLIFLNDSYDGGEFVVAEKSFNGEAGAAVVFPASFMYPHKVNVVRNGERWSCAAWLR